MDAISMLKVAIVLLAITALGGIAMAAIRMSTKANPPAWLAMLHGFLAGSAATLLLYAALVGGLPGSANLGLGLLLVAAAGGVLMNLGYQWKQRLIPIGIVAVHAVVAVVGFVLLVMAAYAR